MIWSDAIYLMIQSKEFSNSYLNKSFIEPRKHLSISHTLPVESIHMVDEMVEQGLKVGGKEPVPVLKESFMYLRSIEDLDGYIWGIMHLNIKEFKRIKSK